jgi:hypothetical protein
MDFPRQHRLQIASTDPLVRVNEEVKCRSDVVGSFPGGDAIVRLARASMLETDDEWTVAPRYMGLEPLARIIEYIQTRAARRRRLIGTEPLRRPAPIHPRAPPAICATRCDLRAPHPPCLRQA